jgi:2-polyprenyl-6-methoxyphenol hydroxylase-like FAD-dependent oxidoreductase
VLLDPRLLELFRTDERIREFWSTPEPAAIWGTQLPLESEIKRHFDSHKRKVLDEVMQIEQRTLR